MWNKPTQNQLNKIPRLYETEGVSVEDKKIYMHFFLGGCDWYIAEYDGQDTFFGYTILNGDHQMTSWGYISFDELKSVKVQRFMEVDRDMRWKVKKASDIQKIYPNGVDSPVAA